MFAWSLLGLEERKKLKTSCKSGTGDSTFQSKVAEDTISVCHLSMFMQYMLSDHFLYHGTVARWQACYGKILGRFTINVE
jgi:hypothetical protein